MRPERDRVFVAEMIEAAEAALEFAGGHTRETFAGDRLVAFAVLRAIQLIGQAARCTSDETQSAHPDIPWRQMIGMRNVVVHDYADVDLGLVWKTVHDDLPALTARLRRLLDT